jgi:hypothetical protein
LIFQIIKIVQKYITFKRVTIEIYTTLSWFLDIQIGPFRDGASRCDPAPRGQDSAGLTNIRNIGEPAVQLARSA